MKVARHFFESFPGCSLPGTVSKYTMKRIGYYAHLIKRYDGSILPHLCLTTLVILSVHVTFYGGWKQRLSKQNLEKILIYK